MRATGRTYRRRPLAAMIGKALAPPVMLLGLVVAPQAMACTGNPVICLPSGNPYPNGNYDNVGADRTKTVTSGVRMEVTNPSNNTGGAGLANRIAAPNIFGGNPAHYVTIEAGASILSELSGVWGVVLNNRAGTIANHGEVLMDAGGGVYYYSRNPAGSVINSGTIFGGNADGIYALRGSSANTLALDNSGTIRAGGVGNGVRVNGSYTAVDFDQSGTVDAAQTGITVNGGIGTITLDNSGTVTGLRGINVQGTNSGNVTNSGTIRGTGTDATMSTDGTAGLIANAGSGVAYSNSGTIEGATGVLLLANGQGFTNAGIVHGTGGNAIGATSNDNVLTLDTGSDLQGDARTTGMNNVLVLKGSASEDSDFIGFSSLRMNGGTWTLSGDTLLSDAAADATRIDAGTLIVTGRVGNTNGGVTIASGGTLQIGDGGLVAFDAISPYSGQLQLTGVDAGPMGIANDGTLRFDHDVAGFTFDTPISGAGVIDIAGGATRMTGDSSAFTGTTTVSGTLFAGGAIGGSMQVRDGGTLGGNGNVGATQIAAGGTLSGVDGTALTVASLRLDPAAHTSITVGAPTSTALFDVTGDLVLDGILDIHDGGGLGPGLYRLFDYGGALTDNGLALGSVPLGATPADFSIATNIPGQVNLLSTLAGTLQLWDGGAAPNDSIVGGGTGTWDATNTAWTHGTGATNEAWQGGFAVFSASAGAVTVDGTAGPVSLAGAQFASDGYVIGGDALTLMRPESIIRVGDGTSAGAQFIATVDAPLQGDAKLVKSDLGTLVLGGDNAYTGGTDIRGGTLQIDRDANLGAVAGSVAISGARLATTGDIVSNRSFTLGDGGGIFESLAGTTFEVAGAVGGTGDLVKTGEGALRLSGTNTYGGESIVLAGTLLGDSDSLRNDLRNDGTVVFDQVGDGAFAGNITGSGTMAKVGAGRLSLTGTNALDWTVDAGTLSAAASRFQGDVAISEGATLAFDGNGNAGYDGALSGTGMFVKAGAGALRLTGDQSAFTGRTQLQEGGLQVDGALGGMIDVQRGTTLSGVGRVGDTTLQAGGWIAPGDGTAHTGTLTIDGNLTAQGGAVAISGILAGDGSSVSLLHVTGDASGDAQLQVQHLGGLGAETHEGIRIVQVDGASTAHFTLAGRAVAGPYDYRLYQGSRSDASDGDWYLRSTLTVRPEPGAYLANQGAAFGMFRHEMGDRYGFADARGRIGADGAGTGWVRAQGATADFALPGGLAVDQSMSLVQAGADVYGWRDGDAATFGVMLGTGRAQATSVAQGADLAARGESRGDSLGAYGTWFEHADAAKGARVDTWLQYARFAQSVQGVQLQPERYDATTIAASFEAGYGFQLVRAANAGLSIEPQLQVVLTRQDADLLVEHNGTSVRSGKEALSTRLGALVSAQFTHGQTVISPYISPNWLHDAGDAHTMSFDDVAVAADGPADRYELKLGVQVRIANGWQGWAQAGRQWGRDEYRQLGAQVGASYRW